MLYNIHVYISMVFFVRFVPPCFEYVLFLHRVYYVCSFGAKVYRSSFHLQEIFNSDAIYMKKTNQIQDSLKEGGQKKMSFIEQVIVHKQVSILMQLVLI